MPIYEYRCTKCGAEFEVIQKMSDRPLRTCRECKGRLEKQVSRTAFQLKGGGWYADGYGKGGRAKKSKSGGSNGGSKSDSSSDSKSDTKSDTAA